jgi:hypothetical protein
MTRKEAEINFSWGVHLLAEHFDDELPPLNVEYHRQLLAQIGRAKAVLQAKG